MRRSSLLLLFGNPGPTPGHDGKEPDCNQKLGHARVDSELWRKGGNLLESDLWIAAARVSVADGCAGFDIYIIFLNMI
jgi:hypothetical protein